MSGVEIQKMYNSDIAALQERVETGLESDLLILDNCKGVGLCLELLCLIFDSLGKRQVNRQRIDCNDLISRALRNLTAL